jgi:hypothetical protein
MRCEICNQRNNTIVCRYKNNFTLKQNLILLIPTFFIFFFPEKFFKKTVSIFPMIPKNFRERILNVKKLNEYFKNKKWLKCKECELIWIYPLISEEALRDIYKELFWNKALVTKDFVINANYDYQKRTINQFNFIKDFLPSINGNFLDFGAGSCDATLFSREYFSIQNNIVIDISSQTKAICKKLNIEYHDYNNGLNKVKEIDFFFSSHSIEHVHSLKDFMEELSIILSKQSHVFVEVPYLIEENDLKNYTHAPHTYYFNKKSLLKTFKKYGLELLTPKSIIQIEEESCIRALFYKV